MTNRLLTYLLITILTCLVYSPTNFAELQRSTKEDIQPNLTRDPFQRARDSIPRSENRSTVTEESAELPFPIQDENNLPPKETASQAAIEAFSYEFAATIDAFSITAGGILNPDPKAHEQDSTSVFGVIDLVAEFDTKKSNLWNNGLFFIYTALAFGAAPTVGDINGISDKYVGDNTLRIIEAWYEHSFPYSHSSFLIGLQDFNNEFYQTTFTKPLLNNGFRLGKPIRTHGNVSTYPFTTLGLRFKSSLSKNSYLQIAIFDDESGKNAFNKVVDIDINHSDSFLLVSEIGVTKNRPESINGYHKFALGAWYLKDEQFGFRENIGESNERYLLTENPRSGNGGVYLLAETSVTKNIGLFFKHGRAQKEFNRYTEHYTAGITLKGIIPERDDDVIALGVVHTRHSDAFMESNPDKFFTFETVWEITYMTKVTQWLTIQPDFQYIQQPSMTSPLDQANTAVIGVRAQATF